MKPLYLVPLALLLAAGCKKEPADLLPKATQRGKNTMGCLVDGNAWTPQGSSGGLVGGGSVEPIVARWTRRRTGGGDLQCFFNRRGSVTDSDISLFLRANDHAGAVALDQPAASSSGSANPSYGMYIVYSNSPYPRYLTGPDAVGTVTLTRFDTVACVASGSFSFAARHAATGQVMQLTEGRFDVRFTKQ